MAFQPRSGEPYARGDWVELSYSQKSPISHAVRQFAIAAPEILQIPHAVLHTPRCFDADSAGAGKLKNSTKG